MNRTLQLIVLVLAFVAVALHGAEAGCKVKPDAEATETGKDAEAVGASAPGNATEGAEASSENKIQAAPTKRLSNKIAFDVISDDVRRKRLVNKIAFDVTDDEDNSSVGGDADADAETDANA